MIPDKSRAHRGFLCKPGTDLCLSVTNGVQPKPFSLTRNTFAMFLASLLDSADLQCVHFLPQDTSSRFIFGGCHETSAQLSNHPRGPGSEENKVCRETGNPCQSFCVVGTEEIMKRSQRLSKSMP